MRYLYAFVALAALSPNPAFGQDPPKPRDRVRIGAPEYGLGRHVGVLGPPNAERLDIYRGRKSNAGNGALIGGLIAGESFGILQMGRAPSHRFARQ